MNKIILLSIFVTYSCSKKANIEQHNQCFRINSYNVKVVKNSIGFGKMGDKVVVQNKEFKLMFDLFTIDTIFVKELTKDQFIVDVLSHEHNSKSVVQTVVILDCFKNHFYSFSAFRKFQPIGYPKKLGARLNPNKDSMNIIVESNLVKQAYRFKINSLDNFNKIDLLNDSLKINKFVKYRSESFKSVNNTVVYATVN